jgi:hypothetical protein
MSPNRTLNSQVAPRRQDGLSRLLIASTRAGRDLARCSLPWRGGHGAPDWQLRPRAGVGLASWPCCLVPLDKARAETNFSVGMLGNSVSSSGAAGGRGRQ